MPGSRQNVIPGAKTAEQARENAAAVALPPMPPGTMAAVRDVYDRLVLDLNRAEEALRSGDRNSASQQLIHAQDILLELRTSLNMDAWDGADRLAQIYTFLLTELVGANIQADADRVLSCRRLVEPLRDAWREAALSVAAPPATATR